MSSKISLTGLVLATALTSGCGSRWVEDETQCSNPLIYDLVASPDEAYTTDSVVITTYIEEKCPSAPILTFPDYNSSIISSLSGYEVEPFGLADVEGIVLDSVDDDSSFVYASEPLPMISFSPCFLRYSVTAYNGFTLHAGRKDTLNDYITLLVADTGQ